jgi:hypothetical protein
MPDRRVFEAYHRLAMNRTWEQWRQCAGDTVPTRVEGLGDVKVAYTRITSHQEGTVEVWLVFVVQYGWAEHGRCSFYRLTGRMDGLGAVNWSRGAFEENDDPLLLTGLQGVGGGVTLA